MNLLASKWRRGGPWMQLKCSWNEGVETSLKDLVAIEVWWR